MKLFAGMLIMISVLACNNESPLQLVSATAEEINNEFEKEADKQQLIRVFEYGRCGFINNRGKVMIDRRFDWAGNFHDGLAVVEKDSLYGFIDTTGKMVIAPKYRHADQFTDGLSMVSLINDSLTTFIDKKGVPVFTSSYKFINAFNSGRAPVKIDDRICFVNRQGDLVIKTDCSEGYFQDGVARLFKQDSIIYIDTLGKRIASFPGEYYCWDFSDGYAMIKLNGKTHYINKKGEKSIIPEDQSLYYNSFSDGLALVSKGNKSGFIDKSGHIVIPLMPCLISSFSEGLASYRDKGKWGFINKEGKVIIHPLFRKVFDDEEGFTNGFCHVIDNEQRCIINKRGDIIWREKYAIDYEETDLSKWKYDTVDYNRKFFIFKTASPGNYPQKSFLQPKDKLYLFADTSDLTINRDGYLCHKLYVVNDSQKMIDIDHYFKIDIRLSHEAINEKGEWQEIGKYEYVYMSEEPEKLKLRPRQLLAFEAPVLKGDFRTQLRCKLVSGKNEIYSNTYYGYIRLTQFNEW